MPTEHVKPGVPETSLETQQNFNSSVSTAGRRVITSGLWGYALSFGQNNRYFMIPTGLKRSLFTTKKRGWRYSFTVCGVVVETIGSSKRITGNRRGQMTKKYDLCNKLYLNLILDPGCYESTNVRCFYSRTFGDEFIKVIRLEVTWNVHWIKKWEERNQIGIYAQLF